MTQLTQNPAEYWLMEHFRKPLTVPKLEEHLSENKINRLVVHNLKEEVLNPFLPRKELINLNVFSEFPSLSFTIIDSSYIDSSSLLPRNVVHEPYGLYFLWQVIGHGSYFDEELKRIRDEEFLVRDLREELKLRIKLFYYEDRSDSLPETIDDSKFWQQISVHGMHSMKKLRKELDNVGSGFCLAKWNQVSILLQTGQTHSCHHPSPHVVPLHEIENNPSALHNSEFKKLQRKTRCRC